jgi:hypothetical protein
MLSLNTKPVGIAGLIALAGALLAYLGSAQAQTLLVQTGVPSALAGHIVAGCTLADGIVGAVLTYLGMPVTVPTSPSGTIPAPTAPSAQNGK